MNISKLLKDPKKFDDFLYHEIQHNDFSTSRILIPYTKNPAIIHAFLKKFKVKIPSLENLITQNPHLALSYIDNVIKDRWLPGEEAILKNEEDLEYYKDFLKSIGKLDEFLKDHPEVKN